MTKSEMLANRVRDCWAESKPALGAWLMIPSAASAEEVARAGFDYCCIDMQHGLVDYPSAVEMIRAIQLGGASPFVRVPWNEPGIIAKMLDAGAQGIIIPMVNSVAEAEAAVAACKYPPVGSRSHAPTRGARNFALADLNASTVCAPMIETRQALDALDDILKVPGLDAVYVGPSDLSVSLGLGPGNSDGEEAFDDALARVVSACESHRIIPGIQANPDLAAARVSSGFRLVTVAADIFQLTDIMASSLASVKGSH